MEKVERATVKDGATCVVLDEQGQPTAEQIRIPRHSNWEYEIVPWSGDPRFIQPQRYSYPPYPHAEIFFVRDPARPNFCLKWGYRSDDLAASYNLPYRLVRISADGKVQVLWTSDPGSSMPRWRRFLILSALWPRLPDGSDELSRIYASVPAGSKGPTHGLMLQLDALGMGTWYWCCRDLRAPIEEVQPELLCC